jgi:hypothetical protein
MPELQALLLLAQPVNHHCPARHLMLQVQVLPQLELRLRPVPLLIRTTLRRSTKRTALTGKSCFVLHDIRKR